MSLSNSVFESMAKMIWLGVYLGQPLQEPVYEPIYNDLPAVEEEDVVYQPF